MVLHLQQINKLNDPEMSIHCLTSADPHYVGNVMLKS